MSEPQYPVFGHYFRVRFEEYSLNSEKPSTTPIPLCDGAFSEITGLEMTMTPFSINEGGRNWGQIHRTGPMMQGTVILKRGVAGGSDLYRWWSLIHGGGYAYRLNVTITVMGPDNEPRMAWKLHRALPVKFKMADLNARATEIAIEELHLVHEALVLVPAGGA